MKNFDYWLLHEPPLHELRKLTNYAKVDLAYNANILQCGNNPSSFSTKGSLSSYLIVIKNLSLNR